MSAYALISVACPHCESAFLKKATLVRPGGQAWCPHCQGLFVLDVANEAMRRTLFDAKTARRRRRERIGDMRAGWFEPAPPKRPMLMGDVLRKLDNLLERMDDLAQRDRP